jgi:hypothetical protein
MLFHFKVFGLFKIAHNAPQAAAVRLPAGRQGF